MKNVFITKEECQKIINNYVYEDRLGAVKRLVEINNDLHMDHHEKVQAMRGNIECLLLIAAFNEKIAKMLSGGGEEDALNSDYSFREEYECFEPLKKALVKRVMELS